MALPGGVKSFAIDRQSDQSDGQKPDINIAHQYADNNES